MRRPLAAACTAVIAAALLFTGSAAASADEGSTSGGSITIPGTGSAGPGDPYPSAGTMSGVPGTISSVSLTLTGFSHSYPGDIQILIQAPSGKSVLVSAYCGGGYGVENIDLTFVDGAPALPGWFSDTGLVAGTFAPTACLEYPGPEEELPGGAINPEVLPEPAPGFPYESAFASLNGEDPNGEWKLWIYDFAEGDEGDLVSWTLTVATTVPAAAPLLADTGVETTTITLGALTLLAAGGILLYTRRRYAV